MKKNAEKGDTHRQFKNKVMGKQNHEKKRNAETLLRDGKWMTQQEGSMPEGQCVLVRAH